MYYINMILGKGKTYALLGGQAVGIIQIFDLESGLAQAVGKVVAVETTVVVLTEDASALRRVGDRVILEGLGPIQIDRREQEAPPAGAEDAMQFAHGLQIILDMLHQVVADHHVELLILDWNLLNIKM